MFYDVIQAIKACEEEPSLLFEAMKEGFRNVYEEVIAKDGFNFNLVDENNNNVLMRLIKNKDYDLVLKYISDRSININHQNNDGDTFAHLLVMKNYVEIKEILDKLLLRYDFMPNIKNNNNETILDKSINNRYLYTASKILSDPRFNNIGLLSFKHFFETYIKSNNYGTYSKLNNFEIIFDNLCTKELMPVMKKLLFMIKKKETSIKEDFMEAKTESLELIINDLIKETI